MTVCVTLILLQEFLWHGDRVKNVFAFVPYLESDFFFFFMLHHFFFSVCDDYPSPMYILYFYIYLDCTKEIKFAISFKDL